MTAKAAGAAAASARLRIQDRFNRCPSALSSDSLPGPVSASAAALHPNTAGNSKPPLPLKKPLSTCIEEATIIVPTTAALAPGVARRPPGGCRHRLRPDRPRSRSACPGETPACRTSRLFQAGAPEPTEQLLRAVGGECSTDPRAQSEEAKVSRGQTAIHLISAFELDADYDIRCIAQIISVLRIAGGLCTIDQWPPPRSRPGTRRPWTTCCCPCLSTSHASVVTPARQRWRPGGFAPVT